MKTLLILIMPVAFAGSRADDCFAMRGNRSPETIESMSRALEDAELRTCAGENLRVIEAVEPLQKALVSPTPETRAVAARMLGSFRRNDLIESLEAVASDENLLVASNGLAALSNYEDPVVVPPLDRLARKGGMIADLALERLTTIAPQTALAAARHLLRNGQVPDRLYALGVIANLGDRSDLASLEKIAAENNEKLESRSRGFGFMPAINLGRAARTAADRIASR